MNRICISVIDARTAIDTTPLPIVIHAIGLTGGKGVVVVESVHDGYRIVRELMQEKRLGKAGEVLMIGHFSS